MTEQACKVLIIGSGPAGLTAAIYAARACLETIVVHGLTPGGQMTITTDVENYPGFAEVIQGPWLMEQIQKQAENVGTIMVQDIITQVDFQQYPFYTEGELGNIYRAESVIIATGAQARWLGLESEERLIGYGVSACATCDGFFYRQKTVAVIGGGNTACEEALFLTKFAKKVFMIHRRDQFRGEKSLHRRVLANDKIEILWNSVVEEILGDSDSVRCVKGIRIRDVITGQKTEIVLDGVFIAIGHDPATSLFRGHLSLDDAGYIQTPPDSTATSIAGIFAAGDVKDSIFRQAVTAAGMGCMAALEAERWLQEKEKNSF